MLELERVEYRSEGAIARLTLNRPEKRNALDAETVRDLGLALSYAEADPAVHVIVLRGAGKDFCAGADLAALQRMAATQDPLENLEDAAALGQLFIAMRRSRCVIVAAVQGNAIAGGAGLATACDLIVAADDAVFGYPEVNLGFVPAMVMALLRRTLGEKRALELVLRGERIGAEEAARIGLVNRVFPAASFDQDAGEWLRTLVDRSASALQLTKRLFFGMDGMGFDEAIARGAEVNVLARMTEDCRAGVRAFLDRQK